MVDALVFGSVFSMLVPSMILIFGAQYRKAGVVLGGIILLPIAFFYSHISSVFVPWRPLYGDGLPGHASVVEGVIALILALFIITKMNDLLEKSVKHL